MSETLRLRTTELEWLSLDGEVVAIDVAKQLYLGTNSSGRLLWEMVSRGATEADLVDALVREYSLERDAAERDVAAFVAELRENDLLDERGRRSP